MDEPRERPAKRRRQKLSVSVRLDQAEWLERQATAEKHENVSLIIQRALDRESAAVSRKTAVAS